MPEGLKVTKQDKVIKAARPPGRFLKTDRCGNLFALAVAGLYAGYTYGFQIKSKAYFTGFLCLLITDVEFIVRFLVS